ncbi:MAG: YihA family ribosome biogenesis GTP-binding protein [Parasporobacterium sp.]|nr:YihA family ribosome biogenesis GTP-binding protein [Parasporobacterium sp.]
MIIKSVQLEIVCGPTSKLPATALPEIAFAGKSNVGKSSLINALICRKSLARTSSQPGKTQTINFYNVNEQMYYVDLPGYGFAKAPIEVQAQWGKLIEKYLRTSRQLRAVFLLVDIRHEPKANDRQMFRWITDSGFTPIIIATKSDKISKGAIGKNLKIIREGLNASGDVTLIPFSSETKSGREEIWTLIEQLTGEEFTGRQPLNQST